MECDSNKALLCAVVSMCVCVCWFMNRISG